MAAEKKPAEHELGTGYIVAPGLVLTARHVVADAFACRAMPVGISDWIDGGTVVWQTEAGDDDVALVRFDDVRLGPTLIDGWARYGGQRRVEWEGCGFPEAAAVWNLGDAVRETCGLAGHVSPHGNLVRGLLELTVEAGPGAHGWRGISGAAVFVEGLLLGVVRGGPAMFQGQRLSATPLARLLDNDARFADLVGRPTTTAVAPSKPANDIAEDARPTADALDAHAEDWTRLIRVSDDWQGDLNAQAHLRWGSLRLRPVERSALATIEMELDRASLIVTGEAGDGKSSILAALYGRLKARAEQVVLLRLDDIPSSTLDGIQRDLALSNRLETVIARPQGTKPSYLLIDAVEAFDAMRDLAWQKIIGTAMRAPRSWRVAIAVRLTTLEVAAAWKALFPGAPISSLPSASPALSAVRHVMVPPLTPEELERLLAPVAGAWRVLSAAAPKVRALLATPFNLRVMMETTAPDEFGGAAVRSQRRLLDRYWQQRVRDKSDGNDRENLLRDLASGVIDRTDAAVVGTSLLRRTALDGLVRDGVLRRAYGDRRVAFSHELLEDYALSLIHGDAPETVDAFSERATAHEAKS